MKRSTAAALALSLAAVLGATGTAQAVIPSGNLLANPDFEQGSAAMNATDYFPPLHWQVTKSKPTVISYSAGGGFPGPANSAAIGGGNAFLAGGPPASDYLAFAIQTIDLTSAMTEVQAGQVQATVSGCLGGFSSQNDAASIQLSFQDAGGGPVSGGGGTPGPTAADRGNETMLLPRSASVNVPTGARKAVFAFVAVRAGGFSTDGQYNDGYGDNLSLTLAPTGSPPPPANCTGPAGTGPGGGGQGGGGGGGAGGGGAGGGSTLLSRVGKTARFSHGAIFVTLRCLAHDAPCKGSLSLTVPRLPAAARAVTLGKTRFSIATGKSKKVRVKLRRKARRRLRALSRRRLRRTKVTVKTRIGSSTTKFKLKLRR